MEWFFGFDIGLSLLYFFHFKNHEASIYYFSFW